MRFPSIFVNHGGGPMPLLGAQPTLVDHMKELREQFFVKEKPKTVVVLSAHWESDPVKVTSSARPEMLYDYYGFPPETYEYKYRAPGNPTLASKIQSLLNEGGVKSELDETRGFDHGVFVPLMIMFPEADIPVVTVSLHSSMNVDTHLAIGKALAPLREEGVLLLGSGYSFHNLPAFFNPTKATRKASEDFDVWLKDTLLNHSGDELLARLREWEKAPGGRISHPKEEHLLPLIIVAAAGGKPRLVFEDASDPLKRNLGHAVSGFIFE